MDVSDRTKHNQVSRTFYKNQMSCEHFEQNQMVLQMSRVLLAWTPSWCMCDGHMYPIHTHIIVAPLEAIILCFQFNLPKLVSSHYQIKLTQCTTSR